MTWKEIVTQLYLDEKGNYKKATRNGIVILSISLALIIFSMVSVLSGSFANYLKKHPTFNSNIKWFKIVVFIGIAFFILFS